MAIETSLDDITAASSDPDLKERFISAAAEYGVPQPEAWVQANLRSLVSRKLTAEGDTVASTRAYAQAQREAALAAVPPAPGKNRAAVQDTNIRDAVKSLFGPLA